eukprot:scaffold523759_cov45-Prasinocladus_malaysianus.AAC.1
MNFLLGNVTGRSMHYDTIDHHTFSLLARFEWTEELEGITISPSVGHLHAGQAKDMVVTFQTDSAITYKAKEFPVRVVPVQYEGEPVDWDDRMTVVRYPGDPVPETSKAPKAKAKGKDNKGKKGGGGKKEAPPPPEPTDGPVTVVAPEPECEANEAAGKSLPMKLFAVADMVSPHPISHWQCLIGILTLQMH